MPTDLELEAAANSLADCNLSAAGYALSLEDYRRLAKFCLEAAEKQRAADPAITTTFVVQGRAFAKGIKAISPWNDSNKPGGGNHTNFDEALTHLEELRQHAREAPPEYGMEVMAALYDDFDCRLETRLVRRTETVVDDAMALKLGSTKWP